jgi:hypothetical protein
MRLTRIRLGLAPSVAAILKKRKVSSLDEEWHLDLHLFIDMWRSRHLTVKETFSLLASKFGTKSIFFRGLREEML